MSRRFECLISVGSNIDPARNVPLALTELENRFEVVAISRAWRSQAADGAEGSPAFVNLAVRLRTDLPPRALRACLRHLEVQRGRVRVADRNAPRPLDLDVVWGNGPFRAAGFPAPSADTFEPSYVAVPCAELWPDLPVPGHDVDLATLAARVRTQGSPLQEVSLG